MPYNIFLFCILLGTLSGFLFNIKLFFNYSTVYPAILIIILIGNIALIKHKKLSKRLLLIILPLFSGFLLATISFLANSPKADYWFASALFLLTIVGFYSFSFFNLFSSMGSKFLLKTVVTALTLNAIMIITMLISPSLQALYLSILSEDNFAVFGGRENALNSMYKLRMIGLSGFASYSVGFMQVIGLFFLSAYYYISEKKIDLSFFSVCLILLTSAVICSRSSVFGVFLWFIFSLFFFESHFSSVLCAYYLSV